jgi:hypothetical protein
MSENCTVCVYICMCAVTLEQEEYATKGLGQSNSNASSIESGGSRPGGAGGALSTTHDVISHLIYSHSR